MRKCNQMLIFEKILLISVFSSVNIPRKFIAGRWKIKSEWIFKSRCINSSLSCFAALIDFRFVTFNLFIKYCVMFNTKIVQCVTKKQGKKLYTHVTCFLYIWFNVITWTITRYLCFIKWSPCNRGDTVYLNEQKKKHFTWHE